MNFTQSVAYLNSLYKERDFWDLEPTKALLNNLGNPHSSIKCIHVTGTNGKGSTSAFIHSILAHAGFKTGLYTSPHLKRITERIKINDVEISKEDFVKLVSKIRPHVTTQSEFEVLTAMAFLYFKEYAVDFAVMEVGLGGRFDATNVCNSLVSVITNVGLEHTQHLGNTIKQIALEKAGIIRENSYCVTSTDGEALEIIQHVCREKNTELHIAKPTGLKLTIQGEFQKINAGTAIKAVKLLKRHGVIIPKKNIADGLLKAKWPGRLQWLRSSSSNLLVDCAHNPHGITMLADELCAIKKEKKFKKTFLVFGVLADKDYREMVNIIVPYVDEVILCKPNSNRALEPKQLQKLIDCPTSIIENVNNAIHHAESVAGKNDLILVTGSIYLVGEIEDSYWG